MPDPAPSKVVLITGCSSGFGLLTAAYLASRGYRVIATMRDTAKKAELLSEVNRRNGNVDILPLDVTDKSLIKETIKQVAVKYGYVDVLVNNAGYAVGGFFEDLDEEQIRDQMETNFFGVMAVTREVIPLMRARRQGKIINISSVSGFSTSPAFCAYNTSKWALEAFSESLRYELKLFGIDVLLIEPGTYKTKIFTDNAHYAARLDDPQSPYYAVSQHLKKRVMDYYHDCHKNTEDVPRLLEKLIRASDPSFRNMPDIEAKMLYVLRKILPFSVYSWIIRNILFHGLNIKK